MSERTNGDGPRCPLVLVIDDQSGIRKALGVMLEHDGYRVITAGDGEEGLVLARKELPRLILLDVMMPGMDGFEVCKRLKENMSTQKIPVIFLTARTKTSDLLKAFGVGGVDYVTKPFKKCELLARTRTHIQLNQLQSILPICMFCKKIRDDNDCWQDVELYIGTRTQTYFSHGICPNCLESHYSECCADC